MWSSPGMANILGEDKRQQIIAFGRLGWTLHRIETATGIGRIETATGIGRETASAYLKAAGRRDPAARAVGPSAGKSGHRGIQRLGAGAVAAVGEPGPPCERLRALPRADRAGPASWPERHGDLARPGREYTYELKRRAFLRRAAGLSWTEVGLKLAEETGGAIVPKQTLASWGASPEGRAMIKTLKEQVAATVADRSSCALPRVDDELEAALDRRDAKAVDALPRSVVSLTKI
jgi:hypothetical protein